MKLSLRRTVASLVWLLAQISVASANGVQPSQLTATAGAALDADSIYVAMLEARVNLMEHWAVAAAVAYLDATGGDGEGQVRLMAIGGWTVQRWAIENRHLLSASTESIERYRVRVRAIRPALLELPNLSFRAFDELFYDFDRARFIRNNVALGLGLQLNDCVTAELYRVWEANRGRPDNRYVLGLVTVRF